MKALVLKSRARPLELTELTVPQPAEHILIRVRACGVCRTDLHVVDGDLAQGKLPIAPGHEVIGEVVVQGPGVSG